MSKQKKIIRIPPRYAEHVGPYVFFCDIDAYHGITFRRKWDKAFGINTCPMIDGTNLSACYYEDYERFARVVETGEPTYFD